MSKSGLALVYNVVEDTRWRSHPVERDKKRILIFPYLEMKRKFCGIGCDWEACHVGPDCRGCGPLVRMQSLVKARPVCAATVQYFTRTVYCYHYDFKYPYPDTQPLFSANVVRIGTGNTIRPLKY